MEIADEHEGKPCRLIQEEASWIFKAPTSNTCSTTNENREEKNVRKYNAVTDDTRVRLRRACAWFDFVTKVLLRVVWKSPRV